MNNNRNKLPNLFFSLFSFTKTVQVLKNNVLVNSPPTSTAFDTPPTTTTINNNNNATNVFAASNLFLPAAIKAFLLAYPQTPLPFFSNKFVDQQQQQINNNFPSPTSLNATATTLTTTNSSPSSPSKV